MNNPYVILNIPQNATDEEIKKAYRKIAKATHPDLNGGDTSNSEYESYYNKCTEKNNIFIVEKRGKKR